MRILILGDVVGKRGRWALSQFIDDYVEEYQVDFVIANVENAAGGFGITDNISRKIRSYGVEVQTSGNHIWDRPDTQQLLEKSAYLLRPANYPMGMAGRGSGIFTAQNGQKVGVLNLEGRDFLSRIDCPFKVADAELTLMLRETKIIIVDFHAEAVSEKQAMSHYLDGRVSVLFGTHTHIQTADNKILPKGTAYITDLGMTGAYDSVLGMNKKLALGRFITGIPLKFSVAENDVRVAGIMVDVDPETGRAQAIERIMEQIISGNIE